MRWGRILWGGSLLPLLVLVVSALISVALQRVSDTTTLPIPFLSSSDSVVFFAGLVCAGVIYMSFVYRLKAWEKGQAHRVVFVEGLSDTCGKEKFISAASWMISGAVTTVGRRIKSTESGG